MHTKNLFIISILLGYLLLTGCASFPQNELANVDRMPDASQYQNKPSVFVDFKFLRGNPGDSGAVEVSSVKDKLIGQVESLVTESRLFGSVTFDEFKKDKTDYTIKLHYYNHGDVGAASVSGFITGFSLGLIPGAATDNYTLKVDLVSNDGKLISSVENKDSITTWLGIWFIPAMGNTPEIAINSTLENQVKTALKQLFESGRMKYSLLEYRRMQNNAVNELATDSLHKNS